MSSPVIAKSDLITATILVGGQKLPYVYQVSHIQVQRQVNRIPWARITLLDGDHAGEDFEISESSTFVPGSEVEIKAGYHSQESSIFKGIVVRHGIRIQGDGNSFLTVLCFDKAVKMTMVRKSAYFLNK